MHIDYKVKDFYITTTDLSFKEKPDSSKFAAIRSTFKNKHMHSIDEFKESIEQGHPFIMTRFKENYKDNGALITTAENAAYATGFALDFEAGKNYEWTEQKLLTFCKKYDIMPNIFYHSFSSTTRHQRFRAVWIFTRISPSIFKNLSNLIILCFNSKNGCLKNDSSFGIDAQSNLITQQYNPGKGEVKILNDEYISIENFIKAIDDILGDKARNTIKKETGIEAISDENIDYEAKMGTYSIFKNVDGNIKRKTFYVIGKKTSSDKKIDANFYNNTNHSLLLKRCRLCRELYERKQDYYSYQIGTGLAYSLVKVRNGKDIFEQICKNNASSSWKHKEAIFDGIRKKNYLPMSCQNIGCPYFKDCQNSNYSPANLAKPAFQSMQKKAKTISIDEARNQANEALENAMKSSSQEVSVINAPVGTGKTYAIIKIINERIENAKFNDKIRHAIFELKYKRFMKQEDKEEQKQKLLKLLRDEEERFIIASPRHNLCEQIKEDLLRQSNIDRDDIVYVVKRPTFPIKSFEIKIEEMEKVGILTLQDFKELANEIQKISDIIYERTNIINIENNYEKAIALYPNFDEMKNLKYSHDDLRRIGEFCKQAFAYVDSREKSNNARILICTHAFLSHCKLKNFNQKFIFIDEDCSESFIKTNKISINTLKKAVEILDKEQYMYFDKVFDFNDVSNAFDFIIDAQEEKIYTYTLRDFLKSPLDKSLKIKKGINRKKLESLIDFKRKHKINFTELLNIKSFYVRNGWCFYTTFSNLDTDNKKVVITSATPAPDFFYKNIFNKRIEKTNIDFVELKGSIKQYIDMSCFRKNLSDDEYLKRIKDIQEFEKIDNVISYKAFNDEFDAILNFGNLEGINKYSGKDIMIVGTYIINAVACQLVARMFDEPNRLNFSINDLENVKVRKITYNNIEQNFITYENENAREYQLWQCWKTMEQAIGRARATSHDCKVVLLSKMIHPLADLTTYDEMDENLNDEEGD